MMHRADSGKNGAAGGLRGEPRYAHKAVTPGCVGWPALPVGGLFWQLFVQCTAGVCAGRHDVRMMKPDEEPRGRVIRPRHVGATFRIVACLAMPRSVIA